MSEVNLTRQQAKIADHLGGPLIVLAGAGSGKTATLVQRVGRLIEKNVNPRTIWMVTFSRKAAKEIKNRLIDQFGIAGEDVMVDTFHGFGYRFMRQYKEMFGLKDDQEWAILTENEQRRMLFDLGKPLAEKANADTKQLRSALKSGYSLWSLMKQSGICPGNVSDALIGLEKTRAAQQGNTPNHEQVSLVDRLVAESLVAYEKEKRTGGYLDFDDLLLLPARALRKYPDIAKGLATLHQVMMVDESQDTNLIQYSIIKSIGQHHNEVVMVGDDDQSIYGWRGARVANLKRFMEDFKAPVARLEQNFRSHNKIVECAGNLIRNNRARLPKKPFSDNLVGRLPDVHRYRRDRDMAEGMVERISELRDKGVALSEIAILYRTNRMTTILEPALKRAGIPYSVVGGMSFYERSEIQAVMAVARIANKWDDYQALKSLQPYIDGLGKKGMSDVIKSLKEYNENLLALAVHEAPQQHGKGAIILQTFMVHLLEAVHCDADNLDQAEQARRVIQWVKDGPMKLLDREKDDATRLKRSENLDQLLHEIREAEPESWADYLMEGPISDFVSEKSDQECVTLSTIHRSKGLEWPIVMVPMSDGLMPLDSARMSGRPSSAANQTSDPDADDDGGKPEEERRLAYVAVTRAAVHLDIFHADLYHFPGSDPVVVDPSPYIEEMGLTLPAPSQRSTHGGTKHTPQEPRSSEAEMAEDSSATPEFSIFAR